MEQKNFFNWQIAKKIADKYSTPCYVYDESALIAQAKSALAFPNAFGLTVRYAMKASSNASILKLFHELGLHIDASSGYEVERAMLAGFEPNRISISSQQLPQNLKKMVNAGVLFNACSLHQLEEFGKVAKGKDVGVRINPGLGSGGTKRTNVGGPASSFGIWYEYIPQIKEIAKKYNLKIVRIHTHIGSGSDPLVWQKVAEMSLNTVAQFEDVHTLDMGGGFKVARVEGEKSTDLQKIGKPVATLVKEFAKKTGRQLKFEIEPGTFLLANCATLLTTIQDICDTGKDGYKFLKLDSGMTDILRPSIYGAQHPISILSEKPRKKNEEYIIVGHCCESGDILTPAPSDPEALAPRKLPEAK
ncbi:MAG: diaminopimelate decarboxylase, partial [Opitutales bacterium]|nr:diaminopimelate decarboxylase [Opitutales bacterium]